VSYPEGLELDKTAASGLIVGMSSPFTIKRKIVEVGRWMYERGYIAGTDGNLSCRLRDGSILITPSGLCKGRLADDDLVMIDMAGKRTGGKNEPSSEYRLHLYIYSVRNDVDAIVHAHPVYSTAFACAGRALSQKVLPEVVLTLGEVPLAPYGTPSTSELPESVGKYVRDNDAVLLANHGLVAFGSDLEDAFNRLELVEHYAHILFAAESLGGAKELTGEQIARLQSLKPATTHFPITRNANITGEDKA